MENQLTECQSAINDIKNIISSGMENAYNAASRAMVHTYWSVGKRIVEQELKGQDRAEYGKALIAALATELTREYGKNYSQRNLHYFRKFYQYFPEEEIVNACVHNLNWTHFRSLLRVPDEDIARYSIQHDNDHLFMSKCLTYLPTKEQLRTEIEREKELFRLQHPALEDKKEGENE